MNGPDLGYRLGLPAWAFAGWRERYFTPEPSQLASYAGIFNCVEGNTTFYAVPDARTVASWLEAVRGCDFRFCFKLPRSVTHERTADREDLRALLDALTPLGEHLGPLLLQFPARVGPDALDALRALFLELPRSLDAVVEVRHPDFFSGTDRLGPLLDEFGYGRVVLDTRALYRGDRNHPEVTAALHEKPELPLRPEVRNGLPFVRLVLHPEPLHNEKYLLEWARVTATQLREGLVPWIMIHCPNNLHCPVLARIFHELVVQHAGGAVPPLAAWPLPQQQSFL